jgi:hypothetical protein
MLLTTVLATFCLTAQPSQVPSVVKLVHENGQWRLLRNGEPFLIKGGGGSGDRKLLVDLGGNSSRIWGVEQVGKDLDEAQKAGITLTVGFWLGHQEYFNYSDPAQVQKQFDSCKAVVEKFKNHPAVLLWSFGNEMENGGDVTKPALWKAINDLCKMAHEVDPNHPTMTVISEGVDSKVPAIEANCPDLDILGINSYGSVTTVLDRYLKAGGKKPVIMTEFGPRGQWESPKTRWNAPLEPTSTEKAAMYKTAYEATVLAHSDFVLGSYAFLWAFKNEATPTWFGLLLPTGERTAGCDVLSQFWTGKAVSSPCPKIVSLRLSGSDHLAGGSLVAAALDAESPSGKPLTVHWVLRTEVSAYRAGGAGDPVPEDFPLAVVSSTAKGAKFRLPAKSGGYRVYAYVTDGAGGAAVANVPLFVDP